MTTATSGAAERASAPATAKPSKKRAPAARPAKTARPPLATKKAAQPKVAATAGAAKSERVKLVRDSFTMPKPDFDLIEALKQRAIKQGREVKKSELLRAGLHALAALGDPAFVAAVAAVPRLKTGRPHQKKGK
jgi:hypothetical protein